VRARGRSQPQSPPGRTGRRWRRPLTTGLGIIAWPLLAPFVLAATFFLFGLALPPVFLRSLPGARDLVVEGLQAFIEPRTLSIPRVALQPIHSGPVEHPADSSVTSDQAHISNQQPGRPGESGGHSQ
jgi:hypothetical protein